MARSNVAKDFAFAIEMYRLQSLSHSKDRAKTSSKSSLNLVTQPTPPPRRNKAPIGLSKPSATVPEAPSAKILTKAPRARTRRSRPRKPARPPCNTWPRFIAAHTEDPRRLADYLELGHKNHVRLSRSAQQDIALASALYLPANNHTARLDYARIATAHLIRFTDALPRSVPVFWVTLIADEYTFGLDRAGDFDPYRLQQWVRAVLPGCSFVGMVEAAFYGNVGVVKHGMKKAVSWHAHLILWGITAKRMRELRDLINRRTRTMIPGVEAAHFRTLKPDDIEGSVLYMLKAPLNEYKIIRDTRPAADQATDGTVREPTGRFSTKKYQLGPGDLVRMIDTLSGKTLDELAFAGGQGHPVLKAINFEARAACRAAERQEHARAAAREAATHRGQRPRRRSA